MIILMLVIITAMLGDDAQNDENDIEEAITGREGG